MRRILNICAAVGLVAVSAAGANEEFDGLSIPRLERRLGEIDAELAQLACFSPRGGAGSNGYRSQAHPTPDHPESIQVDLGSEVEIDEVILVPTLSRDPREGFRAEGFPLRFRVVAGAAGEASGRVLASFTEEDGLLPRLAPVVVPGRGARAAWVRVEAERLSPRGIDDKYVLQLAELLVFSGGKNHALRRPLHPAGRPRQEVGPWGARFLTDGSLPYLMDAAAGGKSIAFLARALAKRHPSITIDLGASFPISQINLHAIDQSDTVPQASPGDFGIPRHFTIAGANQADFSDARLLLDARCPTIYTVAPIMSWNVPETAVRHVRLTALEPHGYDEEIQSGARMGFAEIELLAEGANVALGKPVASRFLRKTADRPLSKLTDGRNYYGRILSVRAWLNQLARRHDLETLRPVVAAALTLRYHRQRAILRITGGGAVLLAAGGVILLLVNRMGHLRHIARIKERIAADLHDELGANVHSIGMLSDLARDAESREEWNATHERIWSLTQRTATAIRNCVDMQGADGLYLGLVEDMRRVAERVTSNFEHGIHIEGEERIQRLPTRARVDLFLFFKECLVNICRHAGATAITTRLVVTEKNVELSVADNGQGMEAVPASLKRRARIMKGRVGIRHPESGGAAIILRMRIRGGRRAEKGQGT